MKSLTYLRFLAFLPLAIACSANAPPSRGNGNNGGNGNGGGINTSSGGSTSTNGGMVGTNGGGINTSSGGGVTVPTAGGGGEENCGFTVWNLERKPADVLLVLDRSASMEEVPDGATDGLTKWDLVIPAVTEVIAATNTAVAWGMKTFPEGDHAGECVVGSVTSKIDVEIAPNNADAVNAQIMLTNDQGDGTPTGDAIKAGVAYLQSINNDHPKYILLATDGEPSCDGTNHDSTAARTAAVNAIKGAFDAGLPTFVVGVATTKASATTALNNMATAGGRAQGGTNPLATKFYLASTKGALVDSLKAITGEVNKSCVFTLNPVPPAPDFIKVAVAGSVVNRDPARANGWDYIAANHTSLEVFGQACEDIKKSADKVEITYGCLGIVPK